MISGVSVDDVISFEAESCEATEKRPRLLNGYSLEATGVTEYMITLKTFSPLFRRGSGFTLQISYENLREVYKNCAIRKAKRELSKWGNLSFTYEITAESYELYEKEVQVE